MQQAKQEEKNKLTNGTNQGKSQKIQQTNRHTNKLNKQTSKQEQRQLKQDHQIWGYSTVTHMEQPVHLARWKDLNKKKRKEHRKKLNHRNGEDG